MKINKFAFQVVALCFTAACSPKDKKVVPSAVIESQAKVQSSNEEYKPIDGDLSLQCKGQEDLASMVEYGSDSVYSVIYSSKFPSISDISRITGKKEVVFYVEKLISTNLDYYVYSAYSINDVRSAHLIGESYRSKERSHQLGYWLMLVNRKDLSVQLRHEPGTGYSIGLIYRDLTCEKQDDGIFIEKAKKHIADEKKSSNENKI